MYKVQTTIIFDLICFVFLRQLINRHHGAICQFPSSVLAKDGKLRFYIPDKSLNTFFPDSWVLRMIYASANPVLYFANVIYTLFPDAAISGVSHKY